MSDPLPSLPADSMDVPRFLEHTTIRNKRNLMTYLTSAFFTFVFSILTASIAIFLQERFPEDPKNAIFYVGIILGLASFFGIFVDTLWAYMQKIKPPRTLFSMALIGLMCTVGIFLFSQNWLLFTVLAAALYGWSYDLYDVTVLTTILKRGKKENYAQNISQKKVAEAIGMIFGLAISGFLLYFGSPFTQSVLLVLLFVVLIFARKHFDKEEDSHIQLQFSHTSVVNWNSVFHFVTDPNAVKNLVIHAGEGIKNQIIELSHQTEQALKSLPKNAAQAASQVKEAARVELIEILAKENEIVRTAIPKKEFRMKDMFTESGEVLQNFFALFREGRSGKLFVIWAMIVVIFFSFWDTMAATFQPLFLGEVAKSNPDLKAFSGVLMAGFILPVMAFQFPFSKIADSWGREKMVFLGVSISGASLICLGLFSDSFWGILFSGLANSTGYAMAFSPAQALFVSEVESVQKEISQDRSAGLLRLALNIGNIIGQIAGGLLFALIGFAMGFFFFGIFLSVFAIFSLVYLIARR